MAKTILVANWKNHPKSLFEAKALVRGLARNSRLYKKLSFYIAPPFPYMDLVSTTSRFAGLSTQDLTLASEGTHTGIVTTDILKSFGVKLAILGHSDLRAQGESNISVSEKIKVALKNNIIPLVCVGEVSRDQDGEHFAFLENQIKASLVSLNKKSDVSKLMIAYEPVWSIGKKASEAMTPADLSQLVIFIRKILTDLFGRANAERIPILYGGSVESVNAPTLSRVPGIRGFLVGHDSLDIKDFKKLTESLLEK